jgi:adenylate cyclase
MIEIERKFLVDSEKWHPTGKGIKMKQGYLSIDPERTVRVRLAGKYSFLTIKGKLTGFSRTEMEYEIPLADAEILIDLCLDFPVEKTRYVENIDGFDWEIDVFEGKNKGLIIAEIELDNENQKFNFPEWIVKEVSNDLRYFNSALSKNPYSAW